MKAIYALYLSPDSAQRAVDALHAAGYAKHEVAIVSSEPLEEYEFGQRDRETWMSGIAVAGGATGLIGAYLLTSMTQLSWPLNTGGMPIVSLYANMVPLFEMTMLGAVLATVATLVVTARLGRKGIEIYDKEVSDGKILIGVRNPPDDTISDLELAFGKAGPGVVKKIP
jgi:hypothetical protein